MPPLNEPQIPRRAPDAQRLAGIQRLAADAEAPRRGAAHRIGDLGREDGVDGLALTDDDHPVVRRGVDGAIELRAMRRQVVARRYIELQDLDTLEFFQQRRHRLGGKVPDSKKTELQGYLLLVGN